MHDEYYFAEACENIFLLFDYMNVRNLDESALGRIRASLIKEKRNLAMILLDREAKGDTIFAHMLIFGVDGTIREFCPNGSRACAAYLFSRYPEYNHFYLVSNRGIHQLLRYQDGSYSTHLPPIHFEINPKFIAQPDRFSKNDGFYSFVFEGKHFTYADAMEPHLMIQEEIGDQELLRLGKRINELKDLFPLGINVNSCRVLDELSILIRTYEHQVEVLTQSCGAGSCCTTAWYLKGKEGTVKVTTLGGNLEISVLNDGIELKGPATIESFCTCDELSYTQ